MALLGLGCGDDGDDPQPAPPTAAKDPARPEAAAGDVPGSAPGNGASEDDRCPAPRVPLASRLGTKMAEICEELDPMRRTAALDSTLTGTWVGEYSGPDPDDAPVSFQVALTSRGGELSGSTTEPNTFGTGYYPELDATLTGDAFESRQIVLLKTYITGSVDHSVLYVGELDEAGRRIEGHWRVGGSSGTFRMHRP